MFLVVNQICWLNNLYKVIQDPEQFRDLELSDRQFSATKSQTVDGMIFGTQRMSPTHVSAVYLSDETSIYDPLWGVADES